MPRQKKQPVRKPLKVRSTYSIGEWYGQGFEILTPAERHALAAQEAPLRNPAGKTCPFKAPSVCHKKGGVCSLRRYVNTGDVTTCDGPLVTTCPSRFLENGEIFRWVAEVVLETPDPIVINQVPFLNRFRPDKPAEEEQDKRDFIGRIDNVLVHPDLAQLRWCALEIQAVYFSGRSMGSEFSNLVGREYPQLPFPAEKRRPDWRSSGPKRLLPQLQTKVPTISRWGKKVAVVIDEAFFDSLDGLETESHLSNAEIAWFVVEYQRAPNGWTLSRKKVVLTTLHNSVKALTGGVPLSQPDFERELRKKLGAMPALAPKH